MITNIKFHARLDIYLCWTFIPYQPIVKMNNHKWFQPFPPTSRMIFWLWHNIYNFVLFVLLIPSFPSTLKMLLWHKENCFELFVWIIFLFYIDFVSCFSLECIINFTPKNWKAPIIVFVSYLPIDGVVKIPQTGKICSPRN